MDFLSLLTEEQRPHVSRRPWMDECQLIRVTEHNLTECVDACVNTPLGYFAIDLETTGLDNRVFWSGDVGRTVDHIVGVCLSPDGKTGYYIPVRHQKTEANVPWSLFDREMRRLMAAVNQGKVVAVFHNGTFDQEFLEFNGAEPYGEWDNPKHWDDTLILIYLENSRRRTKRLKEVVKEDFDAEMLNLDELYTQQERDVAGFKPDFSNRDPDRDEVVWYGCGDAIWTHRLREKYYPLIVNPVEGPNQKTIYQIEKLCVPATRWMMRNRIKIDRERVKELIIIGQREWVSSIQDVYTSANGLLDRDVTPGYLKLLLERFVIDDMNLLLPEQIQLARSQSQLHYADPKGKFKKDTAEFSYIYDILSPQQLGEMFLELEVPGLSFTENSKQVKTAKDELDRVIKEAEDHFPFMGKIKRFREISKALSNYLIPMYRYADPTDDTIRINFNAHKVDTGRFSTPTSSEDVIGWPKINLQSLPATYDEKRPECMARLRECIIGREGRWIGAWDFSGVELRLVTNLSGEPRWLEAFFKCSNCNRTFNRGDGLNTPEPPPSRCPNCGSDKIGDLHTLTGLEVYGQDAAGLPEWKLKRQKAKCLHPDSLITVNGKLVRLGSLPFGKEDSFHKVVGLRVRNEKHQEVSILETYNGGIKPLYHIVTNQTTITCSAEHKLLTDRCRLKSISSGLSVGDVLSECPVSEMSGMDFTETLMDQPVEQLRNTCRIPDWVLSAGLLTKLLFLAKVTQENVTDLVYLGQIAGLIRSMGAYTQIQHSSKGWKITANAFPLTDAHQILAIVPAGEHPCLDLHVDSPTHLFIANGLVCHNSLNFAMCYGGGGSAAQRAVGCDKNEGWRIKHKFDGSYKGLTAWWGRQHAFARKCGYILTAFGRKYPLPDINDQDGRFRSKAERNATNGPIQGSSADITKIAMGLIYREMKKRNWHRDKVLMTITMHDELVFEIAPSVLKECCPLIKDIMCKNPMILAKKWPVPLTSDIEIGYGWNVPWNLDAMVAKEVRFSGNKKIKKEKAEELGLQWTELPSYPEALQSLFLESEDEKPMVTPPDPSARSLPKPSPDLNIPKLPPNDVYFFKLGVPQSLGTLEKLAQTIIACKDKGSKELRLLTRDGTVLEQWTDDPVYVHEAEFFFTAKSNGLL